MTRLFIDEPINGIVYLDEENSNYIGKVLRMRIGEELVCVDKKGDVWLCEVNEITKKEVALNPKEKLNEQKESPVKVTLFQSVSKGERMDLTIQKSVELGVFNIVPVISERTIVKKQAIDDSKIARWQKIALEAARQSGRQIVPEIKQPVSIEKALQESGDYDLAIIPWEDENKESLRDRLSGMKDGSVAVFIGPEGGFSEDEIVKAKENNVYPVTLGPRILRTETAGPAVLAMLIYETEM